MKYSLRLFTSAALVAMMFSACAKKSDQASVGANAGTDSTSMTAPNNTEANKTKMAAFYNDVINSHNVDAMAKYTSVNFVDHNPDPGQSGEGLENNKKGMAAWFTSMPDAHVTVDRMVADGDMVVALIHMSGTMKGDMGGMKATNKSCNVPGVDIVRIQDGKAVERWGYFDQMAMMTQLGMMPMPATPNGKPNGNKKM
jgi:steroid delta-isomerase-like uncharacterized protein